MYLPMSSFCIWPRCTKINLSFHLKEEDKVCNSIIFSMVDRMLVLAQVESPCSKEGLSHPVEGHYNACMLSQGNVFVSGSHWLSSWCPVWGARRQFRLTNGQITHCTHAGPGSQAAGALWRFIGAYLEDQGFICEDLRSHRDGAHHSAVRPNHAPSKMCIMEFIRTGSWKGKLQFFNRYVISVPSILPSILCPVTQTT